MIIRYCIKKEELYLARQEEVTEGACSCAVFPVPATKPIIEHTLQSNVSCDYEGVEKCQQLCVALVSTILLPYYFRCLLHHFFIYHAH